MNRKNLIGLEEEELQRLVVGLGAEPFRGRQLYRQLYQRREFDFSAMSDLPAAFRRRLAEGFRVGLPRVAGKQISGDGTVKFLFRLEDGRQVESVYIPDGGRDTLCISSQVGCGAGCSFCLTARMGWVRNLEPGEIVGQVLAVTREGFLPAEGFNIVYMGMGEPLFNYRNLMTSLRLLTHSGGMNLPARRITVSTAGVVPVLRRMQQQQPHPNLAVSLNAVSDTVRDGIMPINRKWNLKELLAVCRSFPLAPGRRITFEYVLLRGVNDSVREAGRLAGLLRGIRCKVNLIPYNPNPELPYRRPGVRLVEQFRAVLASAGVPAFVRRPRGDDISAACGQLACRQGNRMSPPEIYSQSEAEGALGIGKG